MQSRIISLVLALLLITSACNKANQNSSSSQAGNPAQSAQPNSATPPAQTSSAQAPAVPQNQPAPVQAPDQTATAAQQTPPPQAAPAPAAPEPPPAIVIPKGTAIAVRLEETIDTKTSKPGDTFKATLAKPVVSRGKVLIPAPGRGSTGWARGTVVESVSAGRFKGEGVLTIKLTHITVNGVTYAIATEPLSSSTKSKGKRSAVIIGGGTGAGALIGSLAGGGKGAAVGALLGGGGGTAGAALTGNKELSLPVETPLTFTLQHSVTLKQ